MARRPRWHIAFPTMLVLGAACQGDASSCLDDPQPEVPPSARVTTHPRSPKAPPTAARTAAPTPTRAARHGPPSKSGDVWVYRSAAHFLDDYLAGNERPRVRLSARVQKVIDMGPHGGLRLWLETGSRSYVELRFLDMGAQAREKRLAAGSGLTVDCQPQGRIGRNAQLGGCRLR